MMKMKGSIDVWSKFAAAIKNRIEEEGRVRGKGRVG